MINSFTPKAWNEFSELLQTDITLARKVNDLILSISQDPVKGIGKPEPLKQSLKGFWSRRISQEHRLVYAVSDRKGVDQKVIIIQCRYHYDYK